MKALRTLLRIARRDLDVLRRALADQIAKQGAAEERLRAHAQEIAAEQALARKDYEAQRAYGGYAARAVAQRRATAAELALITLECDRLRALITEAHVEMRKFERLIELREAREQAELARREAAELDEAATLRAGRAKGRG